MQVMFTLTGGSNWMCTTSEDEWPFADQPEAREEIRRDFEGTWGDRRSIRIFLVDRLLIVTILFQDVKKVSLYGARNTSRSKLIAARCLQLSSLGRTSTRNYSRKRLMPYYSMIGSGPNGRRYVPSIKDCCINLTIFGLADHEVEEKRRR
jgi:hypothetical protein